MYLLLNYVIFDKHKYSLHYFANLMKIFLILSILLISIISNNVFSQEYERINFEDCDSCEYVITHFQNLGDTLFYTGYINPSNRGEYFIIMEYNNSIVFKDKFNYKNPFSISHVRIKDDQFELFSYHTYFFIKLILNKDLELIEEKIEKVSEQFHGSSLINDSEISQITSVPSKNENEHYLIKQNYTLDEFNSSLDTLNLVNTDSIYFRLSQLMTLNEDEFVLLINEQVLSVDVKNFYLEKYKDNKLIDRKKIIIGENRNNVQSIKLKDNNKILISYLSVDDNKRYVNASILTYDLNFNLIDSIYISQHFLPEVYDYQQFGDIEIVNVDSEYIYLISSIYLNGQHFKEVFTVIDYEGNLVFSHFKTNFPEKIRFYDVNLNNDLITLYGKTGKDLFKYNINLSELSVESVNDINSYLIYDKFILKEKVFEPKVYNSLGNKVDIEITINGNNTELDFTNYPQGVYFVKTKNEIYKIMKY